MHPAPPTAEKPTIVTGTGTVKWFNEANGFGFLTFDDGSGRGDIFVHSVAVGRAGFEKLLAGQRLSFRVQERHRDGKPFATHLRDIPASA
jgi:CspA family cold shock protein